MSVTVVTSVSCFRFPHRRAVFVSTACQAAGMACAAAREERLVGRDMQARIGMTVKLTEQAMERRRENGRQDPSKGGTGTIVKMYLSPSSNIGYRWLHPFGLKLEVIAGAPKLDRGRDVAQHKASACRICVRNCRWKGTARNSSAWWLYMFSGQSHFLQTADDGPVSGESVPSRAGCGRIRRQVQSQTCGAVMFRLLTDVFLQTGDRVEPVQDGGAT
eukprot:1944341-Rhodomonas_salina.2